MPNWKKVLTSGSAGELSSLYAPSITGSLLGTASFATTASFVSNAFTQGGNSFGTTALLGTNDSNNLQLETAGTPKLTITTDGNVGIGTTNPVYKLDVQTTGSDPVRIYSSNTSSYNRILFRKPNQTWSTGMEINNNFVIADENTSTYKLQIISGTSDWNINSNGTGSVAIGTSGTPSAKLHINNTTSGNSFLVEDDTKPDATPFVINSAGRVGIGIASPTVQLDVSGSVEITETATYMQDGNNVIYIAKGAGSSYSNTIGGSQAGTTGLAAQTAYGYQAGSGTSGSNQTAVGYQAGYLNSGSNQTAVGVNAGYYNSGSNQTAVGLSAGMYNSGSGQTAVGQNAGYGNATNNQVAIGRLSGQYNNGVSQTAIGNSAGYENVGNYQTTIGDSAGYRNSGSNQTAVGVGAGYENSGSSQTAAGYYSGIRNSGSDQTAFGLSAGYENASNNQTAIGSNAGYRNSGSGQTAVGYQAGFQNSGSNQTVVGLQSGYANSGINQTGFQSGYENTGSNQTAIGLNAGFRNSGSNQTAVGLSAGNSNSGNNQTAVGHQAGRDNVGADNTNIGFQAGYYTTGTTVNTGSSNSVFIGSTTYAGGGNRVNQIVIGYGAVGIGTNSVVLGNDNITTTALKGNVGIGITSSLTAKLHVNNTTSDQSFLVEDETNLDGTPFVIQSSGNTGVGTLSTPAKLTVSASGVDGILIGANTSAGLEQQSGRFMLGNANAGQNVTMYNSSGSLWIANGGTTGVSSGTARFFI